MKKASYQHKAGGYWIIHPCTFQMSRKPPPFFTIFNFSSDVHKKFHIGLSQHPESHMMTNNYPWKRPEIITTMVSWKRKIREEYHTRWWSSIHETQTTKTTRDHEDDGIMETEDFWGRKFIRRHRVLCLIFDRWCVIIYVSFLGFNLGYYVFGRFRIRSSKIFTL